MLGFLTQNAMALIVAVGAGLMGYLSSTDPNWGLVALIAGAAYIGVHLPYIQQPASISYRIIRKISWLLAISLPIYFFFYRPTDLILAWLASYILISSLWWIIDRLSLKRDYTRSLWGMLGLPLAISAIVYILASKALVLPVFLAVSVGYGIRLLLDQNEQKSLVKQL